MSLVSEFVATIVQVEQELARQEAILANYLDDLDALAARQQEVLAGSSRAEGREMGEQLSRTRHQVEQTAQDLASARTLLDQLRMI